jgi:hypothetical protein
MNEQNHNIKYQSRAIDVSIELFRRLATHLRNQDSGRIQLNEPSAANDVTLAGPTNKSVARDIYINGQSQVQVQRVLKTSDLQIVQGARNTHRKT